MADCPVPGLGPPPAHMCTQDHLHQDWAHPSGTSIPGLGSPQLYYTRTGLTPALIFARAVLIPAHIELLRACGSHG